jgi:hypothetical protein
MGKKPLIMKAIKHIGDLKEGWHIRTVCNIYGEHFVMTLRLRGAPAKRSNSLFEIQGFGQRWFLLDLGVDVGDRIAGKDVLYRYTPKLYNKLTAMSLKELYLTQKRAATFESYVSSTVGYE